MYYSDDQIVISEAKPELSDKQIIAALTDQLRFMREQITQSQEENKALRDRVGE